jgi:hypothetical protein
VREPTIRGSMAERVRGDAPTSEDDPRGRAVVACPKRAIQLIANIPTIVQAPDGWIRGLSRSPVVAHAGFEPAISALRVRKYSSQRVPHHTQTYRYRFTDGLFAAGHHVRSRAVPSKMSPRWPPVRAAQREWGRLIRKRHYPGLDRAAVGRNLVWEGQHRAVAEALDHLLAAT